MLTTQCLNFVLIQLKVTVQIRGLSWWWQSQALPPASAGQARQFIGQSEAFRVPMWGSSGSWQVTRQKNVNFCHRDNCVWGIKCSAPSPLPAYFSSSCHCICIKEYKTWIWSASKYDKYAKISTPLGHFADGALPLQVDVVLTRMAVTPRRQWLFCSGTLCGWSYGGWFCPSTGQRSCLNVYPTGVAPVLTCSGPQVTNHWYPGLSQFIS